MSDELLKLAERVEAATGPDRMLDAEIAALLSGGKPESVKGLEGRYWKPGVRGFSVAPAYTASLDAAMTLVPEGCERIQQEQVRMSDGSIRCWASADQWPASPKRCATPALALCAAALRAAQEMAK